MSRGAVLSIDTASDTCSVAVQSPDGSVIEAHSEGSGDHFEKLSCLVGQCLEQTHAVLSDLSLIRVGVGPGSFTGLRIGVSFCKGLACAYQIPLVGVCSFEALAHVVLREGWSGRLAVASDARREEVFCAAYDLDSSPGSVVRIQAPQISPISDFVVTYVAGSQGVRLVTPMKVFKLADKPLESINRGAFGGLYVAAETAPFSPLSVSELEPNYLRAVAAKTIEERRLGA